MKVAFIGDIHGDFNCLNRHVKYLSEAYPELDLIIQVGDFGFYPKAPSNKGNFLEKHPKAKMRFIRGNHEDHDSLPLDATTPIKMEGYGDWEFVPDGFLEDGLLYLGGAFSIDKQNRLSAERDYRHLGLEFHYKWFPNEEISEDRQEAIINSVDFSSVKCVISHDCPQSICKKIHKYNAFLTSTGTFLQRILDKFQYANLAEPLWVFGHHHTSYQSGNFYGLHFEGNKGFMAVMEIE